MEFLDPPPPGNRNVGQVENELPFEVLPRDSIVKGIVMEDVPFPRVFNHFYHARTGISLLDTPFLDSSSKRARYLFSIGLDMFGYTQQSKQRAFYYFGRSLHHVQDMSSPAHVHDDAHIIDLWQTDDYEARWVPHKLWLTQAMILENLLASATNIEPISQWGKVWGADDDNLAGYTFNRATYRATLEFPFFPSPSAPTGELAEMFPCTDTSRPENCLHWEEDNIEQHTSWTIDSVGHFNYQALFSGDEDEWWAVNWNDSDSSTDLPDGVQGEYYIEQLIPGGGLKTDFTPAVIPTAIRQYFTSYWNSSTNPTIPNSANEELVKIRAENLLPPAVSYSAGFVQWWYKIANTPPYLKKVTATQDSKIKYSAEWQDQPAAYRPNITLDEYPGGNPITEQILVVPGRDLVLDPMYYEYINDNKMLELELEFNEGVLDASIELYIDGNNILVDGNGVPNVTPVDFYAVLNDPAFRNKRWKFEIPIENIANLNGKLTLTVKAMDLNDHWNGGGALDGTPMSPARRQVPAANLEDITYNFPWHTSSTKGPLDINTTNVGSNAYDFVDGDQMHILFFDTIAPVNSLNVQTN